VASVADRTIVEEGGHYVFVRPDRPGLEQLASWVREGRLRVPIAERFRLDQAREAFQRSMEGHVRGKLVIEIGA